MADYQEMYLPIDRVLDVRRAASLRQGVPAARAFYVFRHFRGAKLDIISDMCKLKRLFV